MTSETYYAIRSVHAPCGARPRFSISLTGACGALDLATKASGVTSWLNRRKLGDSGVLLSTPSRCSELGSCDVIVKTSTRPLPPLVQPRPIEGSPGRQAAPVPQLL